MASISQFTAAGNSTTVHTAWTLARPHQLVCKGCRTRRRSACDAQSAQEGMPVRRASRRRAECAGTNESNGGAAFVSTACARPRPEATMPVEKPFADEVGAAAPQLRAQEHKEFEADVEAEGGHPTPYRPRSKPRARRRPTRHRVLARAQGHQYVPFRVVVSGNSTTAMRRLRPGGAFQNGVPTHCASTVVVDAALAQGGRRVSTASP